MPTRPDELAQLVTDHLAAQTFSEVVTVSRAYRPRVDRAAMEGTVITVVPRSAEDTLSSRAIVARDIEIDVAVQARLTGQPHSERDADIDQLMFLVSEVGNALRGVQQGPTQWKAQRNDPIYAPEHLDQHEVFTSLITVTYRTALMIGGS
ncbi:MAG: hypothetical protein ACIAXF_06195 [Phycisphaerales bacterium JB063]